MGFVSLEFAVEIGVSLWSAVGEKQWAHVCVMPWLGASCTFFSFSCLALCRKHLALTLAGKRAIQANCVQQFHKWKIDRSELFNFGYFFSCDNILERKWNLKIFSLKLQTSKAWMLKADSEAVKANGLSYFVTLAIEESVSLGFINNSFAAYCTSDASAVALAWSFLWNHIPGYFVVFLFFLISFSN